MKPIKIINNQISTATEKSQIFQALYDLEDGMHFFSAGNIVFAISSALNRIKNDFQNRLSVPEAIFFIQKFRPFLLIHDFKQICKFIVKETKKSGDLVHVFIAVENYPEIFLDPEDDLLNEVHDLINNTDPNTLSRLIVYLYNRDLQESVWNLINFSQLRTESKELLLDYKNWYYVSPKIAWELYRLLYNDNKIIPNDLKIKLLYFLSILEEEESSEIPVKKCVEKLCRSILVNNPNLSEIYTVKNFFHAFKIGTIADEEVFSKKIKKITQEADDHIRLYDSGYFYIFENTLNAIVAKYKKPPKWLLANYAVLNMTEEDEDQLDMITKSSQGKMYLEYLSIKESLDFFEKQKKHLGL